MNITKANNFPWKKYCLPMALRQRELTANPQCSKQESWSRFRQGQIHATSLKAPPLQSPQSKTEHGVYGGTSKTKLPWQVERLLLFLSGRLEKPLCLWFVRFGVLFSFDTFSRVIYWRAVCLLSQLFLLLFLLSFFVYYK